jgi:transcriptional regulator with XRE-family HTH domain
LPKTSEQGGVSDRDSAETLIGFGKRLREARERLGLKQSEVGKLMGVDDGTISRWELGKGYPAAPQLEGLAKALGESLDHLLLGEPSATGEVQLPRAFVEFLQTKYGRMAQAQGLVSVLLSVRLQSKPTVRAYRTLTNALLMLADDDDTD